MTRRRLRCPAARCRRRRTASSSSASAEQAMRKECGFSQMLVDDLKAHRHADHPRASRGEFRGRLRSGALFALRRSALEHSATARIRSNCAPPRLTPRSSLNDLAGTGADRCSTSKYEALELDWLKLPPAQGFAALAALPPEEKQRLFAWCIAATLRPQLAIEDRRRSGARSCRQPPRYWV